MSVINGPVQDRFYKRFSSTNITREFDLLQLQINELKGQADELQSEVNALKTQNQSQQLQIDDLISRSIINDGSGGLEEPFFMEIDPRWELIESNNTVGLTRFVMSIKIRPKAISSFFGDQSNPVKIATFPSSITPNQLPDPTTIINNFDVLKAVPVGGGSSDPDDVWAYNAINNSLVSNVGSNIQYRSDDTRSLYLSFPRGSTFTSESWNVAANITWTRVFAIVD